MVLAGKFLQHQPLNRQSAAFAREGDRARSAFTPATPPCLFWQKGKSRTGRIRVYFRDDRPFGGTAPPAAFLEYPASCHGKHPRAHRQGWTGLMLADAFTGFNELYEARRKPGPVIETACRACFRRKFFKLAKLAKAPVAIGAGQTIDEIFAVERDFNGKPPDERKAVRQDHPAKRIDELLPRKWKAGQIPGTPQNLAAVIQQGNRQMLRSGRKVARAGGVQAVRQATGSNDMNRL